jgi:hypothetical protein
MMKIFSLLFSLIFGLSFFQPLSFCEDLPSGYKLLYKTDFQQGNLDKGIILQQPREDSITVVDAPGNSSVRGALKISIKRDDHYEHVANGVPRAEINFAPRFRFQLGKEYFISWSTFLPPDFVFDFKQPEGITQIHEGPNQGSPPWGMELKGDHYIVDFRNGPNGNQQVDIGSAQEDKGKWVEWRFHYRPDPSGKESIAELSKDGVEILKANGKPNAYSQDNQAYLKVGIYKWWWKERPTDVEERTIYFGDILIGVKE